MSGKNGQTMTTWKRLQNSFVCPGPVLLIALLMVTSALAQQISDSKIDSGLFSALTAKPGATARFFVLFHERASLQAAAQMPDRAQRGRAVVQALQAAANRTQTGVRALLQSRGAGFRPFWVQNTIFVPNGNLALARALAQRPEVAGILPEPVFAIPPVTAQEEAPATQAIEWNIDTIRAPEVWAMGTKGEGMVVASIDSGVRYTHHALVNQYRGNLGGSFDHSGNWSDPTGVCPAVPCDNISHGTHTMGTMVGDDGGANQIGVAPKAQWIACKGCITNSCLGSHLLACGQWVLDPHGDGSGDGQPDVVNNSWGGGSGDPWFMAMVDSWVVAGIFPAFSEGNSGPACGTAGSPGDYPQSFASGATNSADEIAAFSARGPSAFGGIMKPDVTAPGVGVRSSTASSDTSYGIFSGTSMASPHTAGSVALLWAAVPTLRGNVLATEQLLQDTAVDLGPGTDSCGGTFEANNTFGEGRIDVAAAAGSEPPPPNDPPTVTIMPLDGNFFPCESMVSFQGMASDQQDGDLTADISWTDQGVSFGSGGNVSKTFSCTQTGLRHIQANVVDSGGASGSDSITITITGLACAPKHASCTVDSQCCSGKCRGKSGAKKCR